MTPLSTTDVQKAHDCLAKSKQLAARIRQLMAEKKMGQMDRVLAVSALLPEVLEELEHAVRIVLASIPPPSRP